MRLAIVGAGPAGLATLRALTARGFDAVAFERRPCIGGVWALHDDERPTAAYRSLHLITSRDRTEYGEFPMPELAPRVVELRKRYMLLSIPTAQWYSSP